MNDPFMQDEIVGRLVSELDLGGVSPEQQQGIIAAIGENIVAAVVLEIMKILPPPKHEEFRAMIGTASPLKIYNYLSPYITDIPALVARIAHEEVAETKKLLAQE